MYVCRILYIFNSLSNCAGRSCVPSDDVQASHRKTMTSTMLVMTAMAQRRGRSSTHFVNLSCIFSNHVWPFLERSNSPTKSSVTCCHSRFTAMACIASFACVTLCVRQFWQPCMYRAVSPIIPGQ